MAHGGLWHTAFQEQEVTGPLVLAAGPVHLSGVPRLAHIVQSNSYQNHSHSRTWMFRAEQMSLSG